MYMYKPVLTLNCCGSPREATTTFALGPLGETCPRQVCHAKSCKELSRSNVLRFYKHVSHRVGRVKRHIRLSRIRRTTGIIRKITRDYIVCGGTGRILVLFCANSYSEEDLTLTLESRLPNFVIPEGVGGLRRLPGLPGKGCSVGGLRRVWGRERGFESFEKVGAKYKF